MWTTLRMSQHRAAAGSADELAFAAMQLLAVAVKPRDDEGHVQFESSATLLLTGHAGMAGILSCLEVRTVTEVPRCAPCLGKRVDYSVERLSLCSVK